MEWALIHIRENILEEISQEIICLQCETNKNCITGSLCRLRSKELLIYEYIITKMYLLTNIYKWVDWIISSMIKFPINLRIRYLLFIKKFMSLGLNLSAMRIIMTYILFLILFFVTVFGFPAAYWWYYKTIIDIFIEHVALRKCRAMYSTGRFFA